MRSTSKRHPGNVRVDYAVVWGEQVTEILHWYPAIGRPARHRNAPVCRASHHPVELRSNGKGVVTVVSGAARQEATTIVPGSAATIEIRGATRRGPYRSHHARLQLRIQVYPNVAPFPIPIRKLSHGMIVSASLHIGVLACLPFIPAELAPTFPEEARDRQPNTAPDNLSHNRRQLLAPIRLAQTPTSPNGDDSSCGDYQTCETTPTLTVKGVPSLVSSLYVELAARYGFEVRPGYAFYNWVYLPAAPQLPTGIPVEHTVKPGETPTSIARYFGLPHPRCLTQRIVRKAQIKLKEHPKHLRPGDTVLVPDVWVMGVGYASIARRQLLGGQMLRLHSNSVLGNILASDGAFDRSDFTITIGGTPL